MLRKIVFKTALKFLLFGYCVCIYACLFFVYMLLNFCTALCDRDSPMGAKSMLDASNVGLYVDGLVF